MQFSNHVKKVINICLLLIFFISMMPRAYFHDVLAHHKDGQRCTLSHKSTAVHTRGFDCHFDDLVVSAPFTPTSEQPVQFIFFTHESYAVSPVAFPLSLTCSGTENRGPPLS